MAISINDPSGVATPPEGYPDWLARLLNYVPSSAYVNPVSSANAAESVSAAPNPLTNPTPVPPALQGGGPPVPPSLVGPTPWFTPSNTPYAPGGGGNPTPWFTPSNTPLPWQGPTAAPRAGAPSPPARPVTPTPATAYTPAVAAPGVGPRFTTVDAPNIDPTRRNRLGNPQITALDLSGLFGGGRVNPANVPTANARPMSGGVLAKGSNVSKAPWNVGPMQKGMVFPSEMGPKRDANIARSRIKAPDLYGD